MWKMGKLEKINGIFMLILFAVMMYSLGTVIFTESKTFATITVISYGVLLFDALFMWIYSIHRLEKLLEDKEENS